ARPVGPSKRHLTGSKANGSIAFENELLSTPPLPQGQQPIVVRSPDWLRATVPGQVAWDNARTAWANDNYGWAVAHTGAMVAEQVVVVLSLGQASLYTQGARATTVGATEVGQSVG